MAVMDEDMVDLATMVVVGKDVGERYMSAKELRLERGMWTVRL